MEIVAILIICGILLAIAIGAEVYKRSQERRGRKNVSILDDFFDFFDI